MSEIVTFDRHRQHAWLHFAIRLAIILLLLMFLFLVLSENARGQGKPGLTPAEILRAEQVLSDLGYWTGAVDGVFDSASTNALIAFQKIEGRKRTGKLTAAELERLSFAQPPEPRDKTYPHIEVDLKRQVMMFVDAYGRAAKVLPVSTGNGQIYFDKGRRQRAHTPRGRFIVTRKIKGWRRSSLGLLFYPNYIVNGIAIHGSPSVPPYPASHGCIRIPMFAAKEVSEMTPVGTVVVVYDAS